MELVIALLVVGALLILAEIFLPGLIAGIIGFCCLIAGVVVAYVRFGAQTGNLVLLGVALGLAVGCILWINYFPDSRAAKLFVSKSVIGEIGAERLELLHQSGIAQTNLRPSGTALINGRRVDVVAEGALISRGATVKVVKVEGARVVVRAVEEKQP